MGSPRHVLFLSRPDTDHLYLTLAVAEELDRRGHRVTFATSDPFADEEAAGEVVLLRYGRDERALCDLPAFVAQGPVDLIVCEPRTHTAATELAAEWGARLLVAQTNLAPTDATPWAPDPDHIYVHPTGRGTIFSTWEPQDPRPVLAVAHHTLPLETLVAAFANADWQVVLLTTTPPHILPKNFTAEPPSYTPLTHADVLLTDGALPAITAALRHATPLALTPRTPEQQRNAERVAALGLGTIVPSTSLRREIERLAADEPTRAALRRTRTLLKEAGAAARVSDILESTLDEQRTRAA